MTRKEGVFDGVELFKWDFGALFAIPIIVFGFNCHANVRALLVPASMTAGSDGCRRISRAPVWCCYVVSMLLACQCRAKDSHATCLLRQRAKRAGGHHIL